MLFPVLSPSLETLQKHTHSDYCRCRKTCHFGFPKPPSNKTIICHKPVDEAKTTLKYVKDVLESVQHALRDTDIENPNITLDDILNNIGLDVNTYGCIESFSSWSDNNFEKESM